MKAGTNNEYHKSVNQAVDYINAHLRETIDLKSLAKVVNISEFHFHRIFKAYIGETLATYVSRLRLEKAAQRLQVSNDSLEKIAIRTGYNSQYSLSKAFKKHFGITPSAFRNVPTYSTNQLPIQQAPATASVPDYRFVERKKMVYIRIMAHYGSAIDYETAWRKLWRFAKQKKLLNEQSEFIGLSYDDPNITKADQCRFYACITMDKDIAPEAEFGIQTIEAGDYAVFTLKGPYSGLNSLYQYIYLKWLPKSSVRLRNSTPFEKYLNNPDRVPEKELLTEVFIPIGSSKDRQGPNPA